MVHQRRGLSQNDTKNNEKSSMNFKHKFPRNKQVDNSDGKTRTEVFERSCGLAQFFVNPWLFLWLRWQKLKVILYYIISPSCQWVLSSCFAGLRITRLFQRKKCFSFLVATIIGFMFFLKSPQLLMFPNHIARRTRPLPITIHLFNNGQTFKAINRTNDSNAYYYEKNEPDYGGLLLLFPLERIIIQENINYNETKIYKHYEFGRKTKCHDVSWKYLYNPNCNFIHELDMINEATYINSGFYRDVFSYVANYLPPNNNNNVQQSLNDMIALKALSLSHNVTRETMLDVSTDALVMERLSASPRIMNVYGHCSTTVGAEFINHEIEKKIVPFGYLKGNSNMNDDEDKRDDEVLSHNNLNGTEKLELALEMALSIAELHGYHNGIIVHDDIQLRQWLRRDDGRLILGDFNRAKVMRWNDVDQEYCKFRTGTVFGDYRSPEEYLENALDEKVDIFSFGNNIYALLTGLWPFANISDNKAVIELIKSGEIPFIDPRFTNSNDKNPRYAVEKELMNIMKKCWIFNSTERSDIFEIIDLLQNVVTMNEQKN